MEDDKSLCWLRRVRTGEVDVREGVGEAADEVVCFFSSSLAAPLTLVGFADWVFRAAAKC
jgi:hypothetical protein